MKNPTLLKLNERCQVMHVHPLTLLALTYADGKVSDVDQLLEQVIRELSVLGLWDGMGDSSWYVK